MQRLARIAGSFAIVLVAYWVYAHTAVRLIEPGVRETSGPDKGLLPPPLSDDFFLKELQGLFSPDGWEVDKKNPPMVLDINNRAKLLLQKYDPQSDGRMKLWPCTMVFLYEGPAENEEERLRQSIVLEAPAGAIIKFDSALDPKRLKFGRPIGGELLGNIVIRSAGKSLGPEDDLLIHARNLVWNKQDATSSEPVDFQWGKNFGSGSGLHIKLAAGDPNSAAVANGPDVSGIELFEMKKIDRLHIEGDPNRPVGDIEANAGVGVSPVASQNPLSGATRSGPIDITCLGAFKFNVLKRVASFENHVEVKQLNPPGPANQLLCDRLSMFFVPKGKNPAAADSSTTDLEPARIEAQGKPVTLFAPNASPQKIVNAQGERLSYNLKTKLIELDGGPEVYLKQGDNEIHGKSLQYQQHPTDLNALGKAWVKGPGWLRGKMDDRPDQLVESHWNGELNLFPKDGHQVISFTGGASLNYVGMGKLSAESIFFWLLENPRTDSKKLSLRPVKMQARKNVTLDMTAKSNDSAETTQYNGAVDEMKVWFEQKDAPGGIRVETNGGTSNEGGRGKAEGGTQVRGPAVRRLSAEFLAEAGTMNQRGQPLVLRTAFRQPIIAPQPRATLQPSTAPRTAAPAIVRPINVAPASPNPITNVDRGVVTNPYVPGRAIPNNLASPSPPPGPINNPPPPLGANQNQNAVTVAPVPRQQRFVIQGGILEAKVLLQDTNSKPELLHLTLTGNVRLEETQTREPGEKPITITGDKVVVVNVGPRNAGGAGVSPAALMQNPATNPALPLTNLPPEERAEYSVTVLGRPALVAGHGMSLCGSNINLDRSANRLWIEGPGTMELPMPNDLNGKPVAVPGTLSVKWNKGMNFDGLTATFGEEVEATSPGRRLVTNRKLEVKLQQTINFSDPDVQNQKDRKPASLACFGDVFMESSELDEHGQRAAYIRLQVIDLHYDLLSGVLAAGGPGWLNSVAPDNNNLLQNEQGIFLPVRAPAQSDQAVSPVVQPQPTSPLMAMHVKFDGSIMGNRIGQRITFNENVRLLYAPASDWSAMLDPDKTERLGPNEFIMKCDNLEIRNTENAATRSKNTELDAQGKSVVVHGIRSTPQEKDVTYLARATRISYNTAKSQLILEGDGRTDVHLYRQLQYGGAWDDTAMKKIIYNRKTDQISLDSVQTMQLNTLNPGK